MANTGKLPSKGVSGSRCIKGQRNLSCGYFKGPLIKSISNRRTFWLYHFICQALHESNKKTFLLGNLFIIRASYESACEGCLLCKNGIRQGKKLDLGASPAVQLQPHPPIPHHPPPPPPGQAATYFKTHLFNIIALRVGKTKDQTDLYILFKERIATQLYGMAVTFSS